MEKTRQELLDELMEKARLLNRDELRYIIYVADEIIKGNKKYTEDITREKVWADFDSWKMRLKAVMV